MISTTIPTSTSALHSMTAVSMTTNVGDVIDEGRSDVMMGVVCAVGNVLCISNKTMTTARWNNNVDIRQDVVDAEKDDMGGASELNVRVKTLFVLAIRSIGFIFPYGLAVRAAHAVGLHYKQMEHFPL